MLLKRNTQSNRFILTVVGLTYVVDDSHLLVPVQSAQEQGQVTKFRSRSQGRMCTQTESLIQRNTQSTALELHYCSTNNLVDNEHELVNHSHKS